MKGILCVSVVNLLTVIRFTLTLKCIKMHQNVAFPRLRFYPLPTPYPLDAFGVSTSLTRRLRRLGAPPLCAGAPQLTVASDAAALI